MADHAQVVWRRSPGETTVEVHGEIDSFNADELFDAIETAAVEEVDAVLVVDLRAVTFCGAAGLRAIIRLARSNRPAQPARLVVGDCVARVAELAEVVDELAPWLRSQPPAAVAGERSETS